MKKKKNIKTKYGDSKFTIEIHARNKARERGKIKGRIIAFTKKALKEGIGIKEAIALCNMAVKEANRKMKEENLTETESKEIMRQALKKRDLVNFIKRKTKGSEIKIYAYVVYVFVNGNLKTFLNLPEPLHEHWDYYSKNVLRPKREQKKLADDVKYGRVKNELH